MVSSCLVLFLWKMRATGSEGSSPFLVLRGCVCLVAGPHLCAHLPVLSVHD